MQVKLDEKKANEPTLPTSANGSIKYSSIVPSSGDVGLSNIALKTPHDDDVMLSQRLQGREEHNTDTFGFSNVVLDAPHNEVMLSQRLSTGPTKYNPDSLHRNQATRITV